MKINQLIPVIAAGCVFGCKSTNIHVQKWGEKPKSFGTLDVTQSGRILNSDGEYVECVGRLEVSDDLSYIAIHKEQSSLLVPLFSFQATNTEPFDPTLFSGMRVLVIGRINRKAGHVPSLNLFTPAFENVAYVSKMK